LSGTECQEVLRELEVYLDGEMPADEAARVEGHLAECSPCFQRQEFVSNLRRIVREKCGRAERLPDAARDRIRRAVAKETSTELE